MPVIHDGQTYYTPEELDTRMDIFIHEQSEILRQELRAIKAKSNPKKAREELVLL